jgi:hypothetical protein
VWWGQGTWYDIGRIEGIPGSCTGSTSALPYSLRLIRNTKTLTKHMSWVATLKQSFQDSSIQASRVSLAASVIIVFICIFKKL